MNIIAQRFFEERRDLKEYCKNMNSIIEILEECEGEMAPWILQALLQEGVRQEYSESDKAVCRFKGDIIEEITNQEYGEFLDTSRNEEGYSKYSWKEMISRIENFEYYTTDTGTFVVDSKNGEIIGLNIDGEIINLEDEEALQKEVKDIKNPNVIKYTVEDKKDQVFLSEKNQDGKYVLKGYVQDENGKYVEVDVGLGRDFLDDTTEIDRQIISETEDVRSGGIKGVAEKIKSDMDKEKESERETVEKEEEEEYEGR